MSKESVSNAVSTTIRNTTDMANNVDFWNNINYSDANDGDGDIDELQFQATDNDNIAKNSPPNIAEECDLTKDEKDENITIITIPDLSKMLEEYENNALKQLVALNNDGELHILLEHIDCLRDELDSVEPEELNKIAMKLVRLKLKLRTVPQTDTNGVMTIEDLKRILNLPPYNPHEPQVKFVIKRSLSLNDISLQEDNLIQIVLSKDGKSNSLLNTIVKHEPTEFCPFCSCKGCRAYREVATLIILEQFRTKRVLKRFLMKILMAYAPMLSKKTAIKDLLWIACGLIYNKKYEHLDFIDDETLSDELFIVIFASVLMVNNPMRLLLILTSLMKIIIKSFASSILDIPVEERLLYIFDKFVNFTHISQKIAVCLFMFEKCFLKRFSINWLSLCQRLFYQHVYMKFLVGIKKSAKDLKSEDPLKNRYLNFKEDMAAIDSFWKRNEQWLQIQKFNISDEEVKRRTSTFNAHSLFNAVTEDVKSLGMDKTSENNLFINSKLPENREMAWQNIMVLTKMVSLAFTMPVEDVLDTRCDNCDGVNENHEKKCTCIACSIAGHPSVLPNKPENICNKCFLKQNAQNDDQQQQQQEPQQQHQKQECSPISGKPNNVEHEMIDLFECALKHFFAPEELYHISWATFKHISPRAAYPFNSINETFFCKNCNLASCIFARKLINNEISSELTSYLSSNYSYTIICRKELRDIIPNIAFYNRLMLTTPNSSSLHNVIVKSYWTFVISLYATLFTASLKSNALNPDAFVIENSDIKLMPEKLSGDQNDMRFYAFLSIISSLSIPDDERDSMLNSGFQQREYIQKKLEEFVKTHDKCLPTYSPLEASLPESDPIDNCTDDLESISRMDDVEEIESIEVSKPMTSAVTVQPTSNNNTIPDIITSSSSSSSENQKRACNSRTKKCCLEHVADIGAEHCKDSHVGKKRLKKDCSHARVNETRDRLRKKLQNSRKQQQQQQQQQQLPQKQLKCLQPEHHQQQQQQPQQQQQQQSAVTQQPISQIHTQTIRSRQPTSLKSAAAATLKSTELNKINAEINSPSNTLIVPVKKDVGVDEKKNPESSIMPLASSQADLVMSNSNGSVEDIEQAIGKAMELCDMVDNDKLKIKKWIDDTLTYIEGYATSSLPATTANSNKKAQPQTTNPKKAAKKAKQKLRKEEEKRIAELNEVCMQFQDIYFKEFMEKIELKALKSNNSGGSNGGNSIGSGGVGKRRLSDKKRIAEIEANIKKLQRAKAKLEGNILELIATVKQTNTEFKFSYLPTKEQQQAKLAEIEISKMSVKTRHGKIEEKESNKEKEVPPPPPIDFATNAFNYPPPNARLYPNMGFPYDMNFPAGMPHPPPYGLVSHSTLPTPLGKPPMCYAPPNQQNLSPNVMAAIAANDGVKDATSMASCSDPSKRIVTIRRVHNPGLPDSQVTVTARGSSPHEDKLLYTFINGQLVQQSANAESRNFSQQQQKTTTTKITTATPATTIPLALTKAQLKKERIRLEKLRTLEQDLALSDCEDDKQQLNVQKQKLLKKKTKAELKKSTIEENLPPIITESKTKRKQTLCEDVPLAASVVSTTATTTTTKKTKKVSKLLSENQIVDENKPLKTNIKSKSIPLHQQRTKEINETTNKCAQKIVEKVAKVVTTVPKVGGTALPQNATVSMDKIVKDNRRHKLPNHGQFDNNPYKSLHLQDSDSELDLTASSGEDSIVPEEAKEEYAKTFEVLKLKTKVKVKNQKTISQNVSSETFDKTKKSQNQKENLSGLSERIAIRKSTNKQQPQIQVTPRNKTTPIEVSPKVSARKIKEQDFDRRNDPTRKSMESNTKATGGNTSVTKTNQLDAIYALHSKITSSFANSKNSVQLDDSKSNLKRAQTPRSKKKQQQQQQQQKKQQQQIKHSNMTDCGAGIPMRMEYFNPNDITMTASTSIHQTYAQQQQQMQYDNLARQFHGLHVTQNPSSTVKLMPSYASVSANASVPPSANISIMDQLNRGVQVENLSLPPGITLTKVDPIKSEQLRQKSESIKRLSQPLQATNSNNNRTTLLASVYQQHHGPTIIAPPTQGYMTSPYSSTVASSGVVPLDQGNIIMVEGIASNQQKPNKGTPTTAIAATSSGKISSKSKRRRNKAKRNENNIQDNIATKPISNINTNNNNNEAQQQPKMITLRNPMFHAGPAAAAATILQQPGFLSGRHGFASDSGNVSIPPPLPMDQPAAIIKNENGMFTIRNPALHQAVTNGLSINNYRQFGENVSYYTPQEAVAEVARTSTQQQQQQQQQQLKLQKPRPTESFSYFSNNSTDTLLRNATTPTSPAQPTNTINITCTAIDEQKGGEERNYNAPVVRPSSAQRCISAIGSEVKHNRNLNMERLWSDYNQPDQMSRSHENLSTASAPLLGNLGNSDGHQSEKVSSVLQDKYHQSSYYNGFDVFQQRSSNNHITTTAHSTPAPTPALGRSSEATNVQLTRSSNSLFDATLNDGHLQCHSHHSCGDDSPPPTSILGYSSTYLDDIPNTGVIRYDDAAFLKNLIPGQRLNKEVSIHNINESTFGRASSPMSHLVEITPVYSGNVKVSTSHQSHEQQQLPQSQAQYHQHYQQAAAASAYAADYATVLSDSNILSNSGSNYMDTNKSDPPDDNMGSSSGNTDPHPDLSYKPFNYDFDIPKSSLGAPMTSEKSISDLNNMFTNNFAATSGQSSSPYLDDTTLEGFVQNLNALQISNTVNTTLSGEQCAQQQLNGDSGRNSVVLGNTSNSNSTNSTPASSWW